ncbi:glycosyltransferase family 4 protein [Granulicella sp. S190]|uniref:glycosyltransferase family 4 protein n=1 Tax=Granulicella sp. S190 TaxID=1747226 RepID=UPI00131AE5E1|nr:glycosyltransferase family 4 protein [Granulicella sp. S190]
MNVLLSAYACLPNSGSEPGNGWNWAVHLAERGIHVTVLTRSENREQIEAHEREHPSKNISFGFVTVPGRLKPGSGIHYALWQMLAVGVARSLDRQRRFDIVHHVTYTSIHVPTQLWRLGRPTVFGPVGGGQTAPASMLEYFGPSRRSEERRSLLTRILPYSPFHKRWLGKMSAVLAANRDTLELIQEMGRADVRLQFDNGVGAEYLAGEPRLYRAVTDPVRLIWVGRMLPRKALPMALDALAMTRQRSTLTIVGNGLAEDAVRQMIAERGLNDRVEWAGRRLTWDEVRTAYLEHDALFFTSLRETSGVQLLEAMAVGLPVITLDLHGARDVVPDGASIKVPVTSPKAVVASLASAIDQFALMTAEQKNAMSQASWDFAKTCTWTTRAADADALYRELIAQH